MHAESCFLTLTYSDKKLPKNNSVNIRHFQLFAKSLRKKIGPFRYFHCGEYGAQTNRPHYHVALYGYSFPDRKFLKTTDSGHRLYTSELLDTTWSLGHCYIGELTYQSAAYIARYILKKISGPMAQIHYQDLCPITGKTWEVKPEYVSMSTNKGIGHSWIQKYMTDVYPSDQIIIDGKAHKPPKYYDLAYQARNPEGYLLLQQTRHKKRLLKEADNTTERLLVKEKIKLASLGQHYRVEKC